MSGLRVLAGNLHDHTTDSDGDAASAEVANWYKQHHEELGMDFETLTDHSDFFPVAGGAPTSLLPWKRQAALDAQLTNNDFSLLRGFEFTNDQQDHLNVIGSQNWVSRFTTGDATLTMAAFWKWISTRPLRDPTGNGLGYGGADGVGQFNHPDDKGALQWDNFAFNPDAAKRMSTIEIHGGQNKTAGDLGSSDAGWYWFALAKGWTVSPVMNFDFHKWHEDGVVDNIKPGRDCGTRGYLSCQRSLVLADENSPESILNAIRHRRTTASELPDLWATLRSGDGSWQGSTVDGAPGQTVSLVIDAGTTTQNLTAVDIVSDAGINPDNAHYDGDNDIDLTSPDQMLPSFILQKLKHALGVATTKKQRVDSPPTAAIVATVPLSGHRATKTISIQIPNKPSTRPDGKHFFYAIAHATAPVAGDVTARAWTGPILTSGAPAGVWLAGDTHVHDDHSSDGSILRQGISQGMPGNLSVADQIAQGERTGLDFMPLTDHRTYDQQWDPEWTSDKLVLLPGEEANGSPHATVLGLADEMVDGANPSGSLTYRHVQQSVWDAHAQNASWGVAHPDDGEWDGVYPNANANVVGVDTVEVWNRASTPDEEIEFAEQRWNHGYRFGVVGGADDHFKELWAIAGPGQPTTWVFAPEATERGIIAGLRAGRTSVSSNPLGPRVTLTADMNGDGIFEAVGGDEVSSAAGRQAFLKIRVERGSGSTVSVYGAPGKRGGAAPIATFKPLLGDKTFVIPIGATKAWYRVEVRGAGGPAGLDGQYDPTNTLLAMTSPLFVDQGTPATAVQEQAMPAVSTAVDAARAALETSGQFTGWSDVAGNGDHLVAEADVDGRARVVYRHLGNDPIVLSDLGNNARFPAVASRGNDVWAVWQEERAPQTPHKTNIVMRHSADGGATWESTRSVTTDNKSQRPAIAATNDGHALVAWQSNAGGAFNVWAQVIGVDGAAKILSAAGKTVSKGNGVDTRSAIYPASVFPSVAVAPDGRLAVGWQDNRLDIDAGWSGGMHGEGTEPDDWEVYVVTRPSATGPWTTPSDVTRDKYRADRHASLAFDKDNTLYVAWDRKVLQESGANLDVRYARAANAAATSWYPSQPVAFQPTAMSQHPQLALVGDAMRVVWYDSRSDDWRWSLWSATVGPTAAGAATRLTGGGNATYPQVSGNAVSFTSDRHAMRAQRDATQGVFVLNG